jgi:hypothetical protein
MRGGKGAKSNLTMSTIDVAENTGPTAAIVEVNRFKATA